MSFSHIVLIAGGLICIQVAYNEGHDRGRGKTVEFHQPDISREINRRVHARAERIRALISDDCEDLKLIELYMSDAAFKEYLNRESTRRDETDETKTTP